MAAPAVDEAAIFDVARLIPSLDARRQYVLLCCGDDTKLLERVEALLRVHDSDCQFLEAPPHLAAGKAMAEGVGSIIGQYKLIEQIGDGGFGIVYMAEQQQPLRRKVALKVLKPGMDTGQVVARFEVERQALALMEHDNIARVLDSGATASGRPYFVMELVKGIPITRYCNEHKLTLKERLALFIPVCQAVQHAHQKGIIHRDLKPNNVLVAAYDGKPVPKVIDFGVAKALGQQLTEKTLVTSFGSIVGTLEYMSPEQAEFNALDIDTRADVYSLGVLLYELLTGTTPLTHDKLKEAAVTEVLRIIREDDPPRPSLRLSDSKETLASISAQRKMEPVSLTNQVRGELDWIVMKCLEKNRNRRYETASGVLRDIERYLHDEPVEAGPPSVWYRWRKYVRRNRAVVTTGMAIVLTLLLGVVGTSLGLVWAVKERDDKALALDAETRARLSERQAHTQALAALRDLTDDVVENRMAESGRLTEEDRAFLRKLIKHFEGLAAITASDAESRAIKAEGSQRVARMRFLLGEATEAEHAYREALQLQRQLVSDYPTQPEYRQELATILSNYGNLLYHTNRQPQAEAHHVEALALRKQLAIEQPTNHRLRYLLAQSYSTMCGILESTNRTNEGEAARREALTLRQQLVTEHPDAPHYRQDLARSYLTLGSRLAKQGQWSDADQALQRALDLREKLAKEFPSKRDIRLDLAESHHNLGLLRYRQGQRQEAETCYQRALAIREKLASNFPTIPRYQQDLAESLNTLGILQAELKRRPSAEKTFRRAMEVYARLAADHPTLPKHSYELAICQNNLGILLVAMGNRAEAQRVYQQGIATCEKLVADFPTVTEYQGLLAASCINFGSFLKDDDAEGSLVWFAQGIALLEPLMKQKPQQVIECRHLCNAHWGRAKVLDQLGRHIEAIKDWEQTLRRNTDPGNVLSFRISLARSRAQAGQVAQAVAEAEALANEEKVDGPALYFTARVVALAAASVKDDMTLREKYLDQAVALVQQAVARGYRDLNTLKTHKELAPLKEREAFKKLLVEMAARK